MLFYYQFIHANVFHLLLTVASLLYIFYLCKIEWYRLIAAYLISAVAYIGGDPDTVGASGIFFALMGMILYRAPVKYHIPLLLSIAVCIHLPQVATKVHITSYVLGLCFEYIRQREYKTKISVLR